MKKLYYSLIFWIIVAGLFPVVLTAQYPTYLLELRNDVQVSTNVYEFDIYLLRTGTTTFEYASGQYGIVINPLIKNGGTIMASLVASSPDPILAASNQAPISVNFFGEKNVIMISARTPPGAGNGAMISTVPPGTKICRVSLSNTSDFGQYQPNLTWTSTTIYPTQLSAYVNGVNSVITNHLNHTTGNLVNPVLNAITSSDNYVNEDFNIRIYPNPIKDKATIVYKIMNKSLVRLSVLDTNGKLIERLVDEIQPAGNYELPWISKSHLEGIYIIRIEAGGDQKFSRITLIR